MVGVGIVFENGTRVYFRAQEFDISFANKPLGQVHRFDYTDTEGNARPIYLTPQDVSGVFVDPLDRSGDGNLTLFSA